MQPYYLSLTGEARAYATYMSATWANNCGMLHKF